MQRKGKKNNIIFYWLEKGTSIYSQCYYLYFSLWNNMANMHIMVKF